MLLPLLKIPYIDIIILYITFNICSNLFLENENQVLLHQYIQLEPKLE